jgi:hypothetical protein
VFVFVTLFLLLEVHATGEKETGVNDATDRIVSVLARPCYLCIDDKANRISVGG